MDQIVFKLFLVNLASGDLFVNHNSGFLVQFKIFTIFPPTVILCRVLMLKYHTHDVRIKFAPHLK